MDANRQGEDTQQEGRGFGRLALSAAGQPLRNYLLTQARTVIGRRAGSTLVLDDLTVSGEHAVLLISQNEAIIQDLGSRNGTLVNGEPVARAFLCSGDTIDIGVYRLVYSSTLAEDAPGSVPATMAAGFRPPGFLPLDAAGLAAQSSAPAGPATNGGEQPPADGEQSSGTFIEGFGRAPHLTSDAWRIQAMLPPSTVPPMPRTRPSLDAPADFQGVSLRFLGGHDAGRQLVVDRPIVSIRNGCGQVAVVSNRGGRFFLTHVEGNIYPMVNGESIGLGAHPLRHHDLIELSGTIIQFCQMRPTPLP
ncbi:MAG: FHA domain-containing protein [Lautropia sp.]|nr:FHA domain-containing protein [Lautropia sp.]